MFAFRVKPFCYKCNKSLLWQPSRRHDAGVWLYMFSLANTTIRTFNDVRDEIGRGFRQIRGKTIYTLQLFIYTVLLLLLLVKKRNFAKRSIRLAVLHIQ